MPEQVIQLKCSCNNYPWGKTGNDSAAARLCAGTPGTDFKIDSKTEYAEMWMGTYPTTPAHVLKTGETLQNRLESNKDTLIGPTVLKKYGTELPFLPKILSIAKALPLQIHPNKSLSAELHKKDPEKFGDTNHKPEIALALGPFEVFAGFKSGSEIGDLLQLKPLSSFKGTEDKLSAEAIRDLCSQMLKAPEGVVKDVVEGLSNLSKSDFGNQSYIHDLLPRLKDQYGASDNGILVALICMNFLQLEKDDALYVPADGIHAYLSGDIVECMARSDNVLNTGFCPPGDRDNIDLFTKTLTFKSVSKEEMLLPSEESDKSINGKTKVYRPALSEFNMLATQLKAGEIEQVKAVEGPSIIIVTQGTGVMIADNEKFDLREGYIFFIGRGAHLRFETDSGLEAYRAYAE